MVMLILSNEDQQKLLITKGLKRLTRDQLATEVGVSAPTMGKLINQQAPIVVSHDVHSKVITWLSKQATDSEEGN